MIAARVGDGFWLVPAALAAQEFELGPGSPSSSVAPCSGESPVCGVISLTPLLEVRNNYWSWQNRFYPLLSSIHWIHSEVVVSVHACHGIHLNMDKKGKEREKEPSPAFLQTCHSVDA